MSTSLIHVEQPSAEPPLALTPAQIILRQMVLDSVHSIHSKRNYGKAFDDLFVFCTSRPLSQALLMEYRTTMEHLSLRPSMSACQRSESWSAKPSASKSSSRWDFLWPTMFHHWIEH